MLVEKGGNIHIYNDCLLVFSAEHGHLEVVKYLIEKGADIHTINDFALSMAFFNEHWDVVKYLIEKGANIHLQALHFYLKK